MIDISTLETSYEIDGKIYEIQLDDDNLMKIEVDLFWSLKLFLQKVPNFYSHGLVSFLY